MQITLLTRAEAADSQPASPAPAQPDSTHTQPTSQQLSGAPVAVEHADDHDEHATMTINVEETNRKYASISPAANALKRLAADSDSGSNNDSHTDGTASMPSTEPSTTPDEVSSSSANSGSGRAARKHAKRARTDSTGPLEHARERVQLPHPLGIKPLGNAFLSDRNDRLPSLGLFARFDDDFLLNFISTFAEDPATLAKLEAVSHGFYTVINATNSIWREAFLLSFNGKMKRWCGSWKRTFIWHYKLNRAVFDEKARDSMDGSAFALLDPPAPRIQSPYLFSDTLYHPFRLAMAPLDHLVAPACRLYNPISKIDLAEPGSIAEFKTKYAYANKPAIVQNAMPSKDWPCREWSLDKLAQRWPNRFFQCEAVRSRLPTYFSYSRGMQHLHEQTWQQLLEDADDNHDAASRRGSATVSHDGTPSAEGTDSPRDRTALPLQNTPYTVTRAGTHLFSAIVDEGDSTFDPYAVPDESPFYLFDASFADDPHASLEWRVPKFFQQISTTAADARADHDASAVRSDLFSLLGRLRPDHRWIIAGPARSGSGWHKDPNGTSAWNAVLAGRKAWMMLPPHVTPPGVFVSDDEAEVTAPLSIAEWLLEFAHETRRLYGPSAARAQDRLLLEGVCEEGEVLYVPSGWWHLVINLEESVALTQNFVSPPELATVLDFMKNKRDQLSGFKRTHVDGSADVGATALAPGRQAASIGHSVVSARAQADEADDDCDGATFDVFSLFAERLQRFDPALLDEGLAKVEQIEQTRKAMCLARRVAPTPKSAVRRANAGPTWWEKLRQPAPAAEQEAPNAFSFSTQLEGEQLELDDVPW